MEIEKQIFDSFNGRIRNGLKRGGIYTLEDLLGKTEIDLLHITHIGYRSTATIKKVLKKHGLKLHYIPNQPRAPWVHNDKKQKNRISRAVKTIVTGK